MQEFKGRVAVVTGGASGIGLAMARRFAKAGMHIVVGDLEAAAMEEAEAELRGLNAEVLSVRCDVTKQEDVDALAARAVERFGGVHIACNNAGVGSTPGPIWDRTLDDWKWTLGVNLWGVVHGIRTFVPLMLKQGQPAHIVNTASVAGLLSGPMLGVYHATKHAVVSMSEVLFAELKITGAPIGVSVLCPGVVRTRIMDSARNRPADLPNAGAVSPAVAEWEKQFRGMVESGLFPDDVAEMVFEAVQNERLYILTHAEFKEAILLRAQNIVEGKNPVMPQRG
jgi:NAD(P)-dependent dehydrogenase (short-subunit alcohol dehydrogenase family)